MQVKSLIYEVTHPLLGMVRSNRMLIKRLFGVRIPRSVQVAYDPTTIALSHCVRDEAKSDDAAFFEMGIGQAALVSLSLAKEKGVSVQGADISQARVDSSRIVAQENKLSADFFLSDLFSGVEPGTKFDLIFFNVPYVPTDQGQQLQLTKRLGVDGDQVWDGGADGTHVLEKFLVASRDVLSERGRVIFGVQNIFVPDSRVCELLHDTGYELVRRFQKRFIPSCCYVVRPS